MWHFRVVPVWKSSQLCSTAHGPLHAERCCIVPLTRNRGRCESTL